MTARIVSSLVLLFVFAAASLTIYSIPYADALCIPPYGLENLHADVQGENLYILWEYGTDSLGGSQESGEHFLQFKRSSDGGKSFGETVDIYHSDPKCSMFPRMSAEGNNVYVMWEGNGVLFRVSNDGGATFGDTVTLGPGSMGSAGFAGAYPDGGHVLANDDRVYAVWEHEGNIVFRKSDDTGKSFSPAINLNQAGESYRPKVAASGSNVYAAWTEGYQCADQIEPACESKVVFVKSNDYGDTFSEPAYLGDLTGDFLLMPVVLQMAADDNYIYVLGREGGFIVGEDTNYYLARSSDGGATFSGKMGLLTPQDDVQTHVRHLLISDNTMYVLKESRDYATILKSNDGKVVESGIPIPAEFPSHSGQLAIEDGRAYFLWKVYSEEERRISFASGGEGEQGVSAIEILKRDYDPEGIVPSEALMVTSGNLVNVIWLESTGPSSELQQQVFMRTSADTGNSFDRPLQIMGVTTVPEFGSITMMLMAAGIVGSIVAASHLVHKRSLFG